QNSSSNTTYVSETINNIEKMDVLKITNCTSSELSHETEVIEDIANSAVDSNTINDWNASEKIRKTISLGYDQNVSEN
ncbi:20562_t:CDS:1, partial [Funneliformis geosporum]